MSDTPTDESLLWILKDHYRSWELDGTCTCVYCDIWRRALARDDRRRSMYLINKPEPSCKPGAKP